jgi:hypothetical protein
VSEGKRKCRGGRSRWRPRAGGVPRRRRRPAGRGPPLRHRRACLDRCGERNVLGFEGSRLHRSFLYHRKKQATVGSDRRVWTAEIARGHRQLLGRILAQVGGARMLLWQPARRLLGRWPRPARGGGRGPVLACGLKRESVNSAFCHFILTIFQKQLFVF